MFWAAVRHRRGQSLALVLVSALVTTCAVFAPLFVRTLEQGLLRVQVTSKEPADLAMTLRTNRSGADDDVAPAALDALVPSGARRWFEPGVGMTTADTRVAPAPGKQSSPVRLRARDGFCEHVTITGGRCPSAAGEVLVSAADATAWSWRSGTVLTVTDVSAVESGTPGSAGGGAVPDVGSPGTGEVPLTVVGVYTVRPDPGYWLRTRVDGTSGVLITEGMNIVPGVDDLLTGPETFAAAWGRASVSYEIVLDREQVTRDTVTLLRDSLAAVGTTEPDVTVISPVPALVASVASGQRLLRSLVPLLLAQVALLAVTVLVLVAQAAVGQRRPEVALARLRGRGPTRSTALLVGELALVVVLGVPVGVVVAFLGNELLRRLVVPAGVPFEVSWAVPAAAGVALAVSLASVVAVARPVAREPVAGLLRRVPAGRRGVVGVVDTVVIAAALLVVAGVLTGDIGGSTALLTPVLLGLAAGLAGAAVVRAVAVRAGRRALRRGRVAPALAAFALARRPTLRGSLVAVTTATALVTFAASAVVVAERARAERAQLEAGAATVLDTEAASAERLAAAVDGLEPALRRVATPVVLVRPRESSAVDTLLARPAELERIAFPVPGVPLGSAALTPPTTPTVRLDGEVITASLEWRLAEFRRPGEGGIEAPSGATGIPRPPTSPLPAPVRVGVTVTMPDGETLDRDLASVPQQAAGRTSVRARVLCPDGCRLAGLWVRQTDQVAENVTGRMTFRDLALDGASLPIGDTAGWRDPEAESDGAAGSQRLSGAGTELVVDFANTGRRLVSTRADVPDPAPVLLAGAPPADAVDDDFTLVGLGSRPVTSRAVQRVPMLPALTGRGALGDLDAQLRVGGEVPPRSALQVWSSTTDPAVADRIADGIAARGVGVRTTTTAAAQQDRYDRSATGWGLLLGVFTGIVAVLVALLVVVVGSAMSWRQVARDLAGLRIAGVPPRVLAAALRYEQSTTVVAGVVLGTLCGVAGALLATPLLPLFDSPASVPVADLTPAWAAVAAAAVLTLVLVGGAALVSARSVAARGEPSRVRETA
ncbi:MAG: FtsX-like permease family protein [Phycicoccus sp.]